MPTPDPQALDRYVAAVPERPQSFAERGVAVPFTAPMLAGARLRRGDGDAAELIVPPLGGRGVYVLSWEACLGLANPTLHDRRLWARLLALPRLTPAAMRAAARAVAAEGFAGRAAQAASRAATQALDAARDAARRRLAAPEEVVAALAELGFPGPLLGARRAALARLGEAAAAVAGPDGPDRQAALLVAAASRLTATMVEAGLPALSQALAAPPATGEAAQLLALAERPDWLLDGWDALAALCAATPAEERGAALRDALARLPVPPLEAETPSADAAWDAVLLGRRRVAPRPSWLHAPRTAAVARNEQARAIAA
jgi:hypothetical protein